MIVPMLFHFLISNIRPGTFLLPPVSFFTSGEDDFVVFEYGDDEFYGVAVSTNGAPGGLTAMIDYNGTQAIDLDDPIHS